MAKSDTKEARRIEAEKRRKRRNRWIIIGVAACCALAIALAFVLQPKPISAVRGANAELIVQDADIRGGLNHVRYGGPKDLLYWRDADGEIRTAFDTCEECYASADTHYSLRGGELICSSCQTRLPVSTLGAHSWGGCQPVAIPVDFRQDTDTAIVIPADVLAHAEEVFAEWDAGNFAVSLGDFGHAHAEDDDHDH